MKNLMLYSIIVVTSIVLLSSTVGPGILVQASVSSGGYSFGSGNNFNSQSQKNSGSNVAGQNGNNNNAHQSISQNQENHQRSNVVSGGYSFNLLSPFNSGDSSLAQLLR